MARDIIFKKLETELELGQRKVKKTYTKSMEGRMDARHQITQETWNARTGAHLDNKDDRN